MERLLRCGLWLIEAWGQEAGTRTMKKGLFALRMQKTSRELGCRYLGGLYSGWLSRRDSAVGICEMTKNIWGLFTGSGGR